MLTTLLILCLLLWFPILLYQVTSHGFLVLILWLLIAPVATNLVQGESNPFFTVQKVQGEYGSPEARRGGGYLKAPTSIRLRELLEPTRIIFSVFFISFLLDALLKKRPVVPLDWTEMWMGAFALIVIVSVLLRSRRLEFGLRIAVDAFVIPFMGYYIARRLIRSEDRLLRLTRIIGYTGFYLILICLIERLMSRGLLYRIHGPFASGQVLHVVLAVAFFTVLLESVCSGHLLGERRPFPQGIRRFVLYLAPVMILLTFSRGNWAGFIAGVCVLLLLGRRLIGFSRKLVAIGLIVLLAPLFMLSLPVLTPQEFVEERAVNLETVNWRFLEWQRMLEKSDTHLLFGIGLNNSRDVLGGTPHNTVLSFFIELGAVGLLTYLALVTSIICMGLRIYRVGVDSRDRWRGIAVIVVMVDYLVPALFFETLYQTELSHVFVYVFVGGIAGLSSQRRLGSSFSISRASSRRIYPDLPMVTR
jgi:O-antigen ligase